MNAIPPPAGSRPLSVGLHLPSAGPLAEPALVRDAAALAEASGFDSVWLFDHLLTPVDLESAYPYTPDGEYLFAPEQSFFDALAVMGWVAGATDRVQIGTAVTVPGYRHPLTFGRYLASLDALCGGRLVLGAGAGWMREEFEAMDVDPSERGDRLEELIEAMRTAWSNDASSFEGTYFNWREAGMLPRPHEGRSIPVLIGGHSRTAIRRAAQLGDGWAATIEGTYAPSLDDVADRLATFDAAVDGAGREREDLHVHLFCAVSLRPWSKDGPRPLLRGAPDEVAADVHRLAEVGVQTLDCFVLARDADGWLNSAQELADELLARLDQDS